MAKKLTLKDLMEQAARYGVSENALFVSACNRYMDQMEIIERMRDDIKKNGLMVEHTNVKGDVNMDVNPLTVQLPKYTDAANKTLAIMLDVIQKMGTTAPAGDKLGEFLNE